MDVLATTLELIMATEALKDDLEAIMGISEPAAFEALIAGLTSSWCEVHGKTLKDELEMYEDVAKLVRETRTEGDE